MRPIFRLILAGCTIWLLLLSMYSWGQNVNPTPLTYDMLLPNFKEMQPAPMAFETYGSYESSEYTGTPEISIPLLEVSSGKLRLPVSLKYEASGIRVSQQASSVGLGWGLVFGGSITHIVNGQDDFCSFPQKTDKEFLDSIYSIATGYHTAYVPQDYLVDWDLGLGLLNISQAYQVSSRLYWRSLLMEDLVHGMHIPDVFHANFCGHTVAFTLDNRTRNMKVLDDNASKYKIETEYTGAIYPFKIFITDDMGIKYVFQAYSEYDKLDCYYLTEIRGLNPNDVITLSYNQFRQKGQYEIYQSLGHLKTMAGAYPGDLNDLLGLHTRTSTPSLYRDMLYPSVVESHNEKVLFDLEDRLDVKGSKAIKNIRVLSKNGNVQTHQITFGYDYFYEEQKSEATSWASLGYSDDEYSGKRLKLINLVIDDKKYSFSYDETTSLPYVTSLSQDYWGYYNGVNNRKNFCSSPAYSIAGRNISEIEHLGDANRLASPKKILCGILKRIVYPTGGYTDFEFESHHFNDSYYYPSAESPNRMVTSSVSVYSVAAQKEKPNRESFILSEEKDIEFIVNINSKDPAKYSCSATIWCAQGTNYHEVFSTSTSTPGMSKTFTRHLKPGVYVIYVTVPYVPSDYVTTASIRATTGHSFVLDESIADSSGLSIGGGVRIKSITNYDGHKSDFVSKTCYEYYNGKLLVPTVRCKNMALNFSSQGSLPIDQLTYSFVGSQKSDLSLMSLGVPTVGYSVVKKKVVNTNGQDNGYIVSNYENQTYREMGMGEQYYYPNYGLNGKILTRKIYSSTDELVQQTDYTYGSKKYEEILFPKCLPLFLSGTAAEGCTYHLSIYTKANVWNYLDEITETSYVNGKALLPKKITFGYDQTNYKENRVVTTNGIQKSQKVLTYPHERTSTGAEGLQEKHCLAEVTGMDNYMGTSGNTLVGGYRKNYSLVGNAVPMFNEFLTKGTDGKMRQDLKVEKYDSYGNILEYTTNDGLHTVLLWSYSYQCPIMEIVGTTYDKVSALSTTVRNIGSKATLTAKELKDLYDLVVKGTNAHVTAYLYNPWYKVSEMILPNGNINHYEYDAFGRLVSEKDIDSNPLTTYKYFYRQ